MVTPPYARAIRPALLALLPVLFVLLIAPATALVGPSPASGAASPAAPREMVGWTLDGQLAPGSRAVVRADGDCLRLREKPELGALIILCLPEGSLVTVQDGTVQGPEYRWQRVEYRGQSGWVADQYLKPSEEPECGVGQGVAGISRQREIHPSGITAIVSPGGTAEGVITAALAQGVHVESVWAEAANRQMLVGYITGAPEFVNEAWRVRFPEGVLSPGSVFVVRTGEPTGTTPAVSLAQQTASPVRVSSESAPPVSAVAAVLIDQASGEVLYEKDAHRPLPPASLTKIATAILAIEGSDLDHWVANDVDSRTMIGSSLMGLLPGDCFQLRDLLYGMMLRSGNDAALAIGRHVAGSDEAFVEMMNALVARLGLSNSAFRNAHGLDAEGHHISAFDLAMVTRYAMGLPAFREIVAQHTWVARGSRTLWMSNLNRFIDTYPGGDGVKTGFTENAGRSLVASASRDGHRLIAVLLNAPDRYGDATRLMNWAYRTHEWPASSASAAMRFP